METYEELIACLAEPDLNQFRDEIHREAMTLMPTDVRLRHRVIEIVGDVALVSDILERLDLHQGMGPAIGRTLASLGFKRKPMMLRTVVYPLWIRQSRYPRYELQKLLDAGRIRRGQPTDHDLMMRQLTDTPIPNRTAS